MRIFRPAYLGWILFYLFIASLLAANTFGYLDPDFGWHLRFGEIIAQTKNVPHDQIFMWPLEGKTWVDHEWLANLITYLCFSAGGYIGVGLFFIALPLLALIIVNSYIFRQYLFLTRERVAFACVETAALFACLPHFGVRVQEFGFLFFIIELIIIDSFRRTKKISVLPWLIPLLFLWTCTHGSYLIGAAVLVGWIGYETLVFFIPRFAKALNEKSLTKKSYLQLVIIVITTIASTLATPYGLRLYEFLGDYGANRYYLSHIEEWRSPFSSRIRYDQIAYSICIVSFGLGSWLFSKRRIPLWQLVILLALLAASLRSVRHFPLWAAGSLLFLVPSILGSALQPIHLPYPRYLKIAGFICLTAVFISLALRTQFTQHPFTKHCDSFPCGAVSFLRHHPEYSKLRLFNDYGWGGYLIGALPEFRPFIDGRLPQYPFANKSILEEYSSFFNTADVEKKLSEYSIELIIFKAQEKPYRPDLIEKFILGKKDIERTNPLLEFLKSSSDWKEIYRDATSVIYVRTDKT